MIKQVGFWHRLEELFQRPIVGRPQYWDKHIVDGFAKGAQKFAMFSAIGSISGDLTQPCLIAG